MVAPSRVVHQHPEIKHGPYLGLRGSNSNSEGTYLPAVCGFQASKSPNEPPRPPYQWSLGAAGGQPSPRIVCANAGSTRVPGAKEMIFSKLYPDH